MRRMSKAGHAPTSLSLNAEVKAYDKEKTNHLENMKSQALG